MSGHQKKPVLTGDRFGRLVAIEMGEPYLHPRGEVRERWWFECDCGNRFLWQASAARSNARLGWGCCPSCIWCIRAAGEPSARALASTAPAPHAHARP